jgi:predicted CoA-binding protein
VTDDEQQTPASRRRADRERVRAILDLHEGRGPVQVLDDDGIAAVLGRARRIAVVGASSKAHRPSHGVIDALLGAGYEVVPVSPHEAEVLGRRCYPDLASAVAATGPVDIVDVFRRAEACPEHAREAVAVGAGCLWLQLGVVSWEAARIAEEGGIPVVMDRCTAIEVSRIRHG